MSPESPLLKTCPKCSVFSPADTWLCRCGYEFSAEEPTFPAPPAVPAVSFGKTHHFPLVTIAAILTLVTALVLALSADLNSIRANSSLPGVAISLVLGFIGYVALLTCWKIVASPKHRWGIKLLSVLWIVVGLFFLTIAVIFGGCATGIFRYKI